MKPLNSVRSHYEPPQGAMPAPAPLARDPGWRKGALSALPGDSFPGALLVEVVRFIPFIVQHCQLFIALLNQILILYRLFCLLSKVPIHEW
jgi:hypothetical protein